MTHRRAARHGASPWTDEAILEALHMMDHDGISASEIGRRLGVTKNAVLGQRNRTLLDSLKRHPETTGDGTMAPGWWRR